jgi:hypothetical protein
MACCRDWGPRHAEALGDPSDGQVLTHDAFQRPSRRAATPPAELIGLDDPAGRNRTTGLEPLTRDLQAEFVKPAGRA